MWRSEDGLRKSLLFHSVGLRIKLSVSLGTRPCYPLSNLRQDFRLWSATGVNIDGGLLERNEVFYIFEKDMNFVSFGSGQG